MTKPRGARFVASIKFHLFVFWNNMTILYERSVLEDKIRDDGRSMKSLEHAMEIMSADSACSNEASRAFIQLGGIRQFIYTFQDGAEFLDISVERC